MKKSIKTILLIVPFILSSASVLSQESRVDLGNKYFDQYAYKKAIKLYEKANKDWKIYANLGDCYYFTSQPEKAVVYYRQALSERSNNMDRYRLRYVLSMLSIDNCINVIKELKKEKDTKTLDVLGDYFGIELQSGDISMDIESQICNKKNSPIAEIEIQNLDINSKNSDFGAYVMKDVMYFSSSRENPTKKRKFNKRLYKWNEHPFLDFYEAIIIEDSDSINSKLVTEENSKININTTAHEAGIAITNDGKTMYFSGGEVKANNKLIYNKLGTSTLKLKKASLINNKWSVTGTDKRALDALNLENYSVGNPALSPDNKKLFFVTCAPYPDAMGQTDIYYVNLVNGEISMNPKIHHLDKVNTSGRETFPYISEDNILYFSSDGVYEGQNHMGLLDVYSYDLSDPKAEVKTLGEPFNSRKDDFAYVVRRILDSSSNYTESGYFSSNRETFVHRGDTITSKGDDDIYRFSVKRICKNIIKGTVSDLRTGDYLKEAIVELIDDSGMILDTLQVNSSGAFSVKLDCDRNYSLRGSNALYDDDLQRIDAANSSILNKNINLQLKPFQCQFKIDPIEFERDQDLVRPEEGEKLTRLIDLLLSNPELRVRIESHTDSIGTVSYNLKLSQKRANSTEAYLINKGVDKSQILGAIGLGESLPINTTKYINTLPTPRERKEAHDKNRRSLLTIEGCADD